MGRGRGSAGVGGEREGNGGEYDQNTHDMYVDVIIKPIMITSHLLLKIRTVELEREYALQLGWKGILAAGSQGILGATAQAEEHSGSWEYRSQ